MGACQTGMVIWSGRAHYLGWPDKPQIWCPRDWGWGRAGFPSLAFLLPQHFPLWMDWAGMDLSPGCAPFMGHIEAQDSRRTGLTVRRPLCMQHAAMQRNLPGWQTRLSGRCPGALGKEGRKGGWGLSWRDVWLRACVSFCLQTQKCKKYSLIVLGLHSPCAFQGVPTFSLELQWISGERDG